MRCGGDPCAKTLEMLCSQPRSTESILGLGGSKLPQSSHRFRLLDSTIQLLGQKLVSRPHVCALNRDDLQEMIVYGQFYLPLSAVYWIMKKDEFRTTVKLKAIGSIPTVMES